MSAERAIVADLPTDAADGWTVGVDLTSPDALALLRRIFYARFSAWAESVGLDPEDVLAAVVLGIYARNRGRRPYDPTISKLSTYLYTVCRSVTLNQIEKARSMVYRCGEVAWDYDLSAPIAGPDGAGEDRSTWQASLAERGGPQFWAVYTPPPGRRVHPVVPRARRRRRRREAATRRLPRMVGDKPSG